jgi:hypothetical protein
MKIIKSRLSTVKAINLSLVALLVSIQVTILNAQVSSTLEKRIRIGSLQSHFTAYGSERAWNGSAYIGMDWPADYALQDNAVIERSWLGCDNFTDAENVQWDKYAVYITSGLVDELIFPVKNHQTAKFQLPTVYVDGIDINGIYLSDVDTIDATIIPDRIVRNVVNTSMGLTMERKVLAFSNPLHDDYFIKEYTFTNTGNVDYDDEIELSADLSGVRVMWSVRYATCRDGATKYDNSQSWGKYSWISKRGENFPSHTNDQIPDDYTIVDWLRCGFSWAGQSDLRGDWDNIGAPDINRNGRLASPQFAGTVILHVDQSWNDSTDNPNQPAVLGWHAGDTYPNSGLSITDPNVRNRVYDMMTGNPYPDQNFGGTNRFYENNTSSITDRVSPWTLHNDGGGTNVWIAYGPFDIPFGESIRIVEAEAVNGLSREMCNAIGERWLEAYRNDLDTGPFDLPNGGTTDDEDIYKNSWFYTGVDSLLLTFGRAKRNYDSDYLLGQSPLPPPYVEVKSGGDRISILWDPSESESDPNFVGYKVFRGIGKADTSYQEIYNGPKEVRLVEDTSPTRGFAYYYYVVSVMNDPNTSRAITSGRFYTQTTEAAFLQREAGESLKDIRVVPNPYNIKARGLNYPEEYDKIGFLNIPAFCTIKIFTERGDLISTLEHTDGSGDEYWNSITSSRQVVASGLYIAYFEVTQDYVHPVSGKLLYKKGENTFRKFIIIR